MSDWIKEVKEFGKNILSLTAGQGGFKKYLSNTSWMFFGQLFGLIINFFIGAWLARYFGPSNYGVLNYALSFVGIFTFIANLGVASILLRELVENPDKKDNLLGTSFVILMVGGLSAFVLVLISVFVVESSHFNRFLIILYSFTFLWSAFGVIQVYFQSLVQAKKNVYAGVISSVVSAVFKVLIILLHKGVAWLMFAMVSESLLSIVITIINYSSFGYRIFDWRFDKKIAKYILSGSWLMTLAASASYLFMKVDQVMIKWYLGEKAVGFYAAAVRLTEVWYFIPGLICSSLFPAIINAKKIDKNLYSVRLNLLYSLLAFIALIIAIPATILAPWIIKMLFGAAFSDSVSILRIYIWSGVGLFVLWGMQQYYLAENKLFTIFLIYFISMLINIGLNIVLIPAMSLNGAAWATFISYSIGPIAVLLSKRFRLFTEIIG